jgi:hypothetical protein
MAMHDDRSCFCGDSGFRFCRSSMVGHQQQKQQQQRIPEIRSKTIRQPQLSSVRAATTTTSSTQKPNNGIYCFKQAQQMQPFRWIGHYELFACLCRTWKGIRRLALSVTTQRHETPPPAAAAAATNDVNLIKNAATSTEKRTDAGKRKTNR